MQLESEPQPESSHKWITRIIEGVILVLALALGLTIRLAVLETAIVVSGSMQPTLDINDRVLIDHRASLHGKWRRGDILLFAPPKAWRNDEPLNDEPLTKRLIGLPGETIALVGNEVFINGKELPERYVHAPQREYGQTILLGEGQYFVMGDNRANSQDSRDLGPINEVDIEGRAIYRLTPLGRAGKLPLPEYPF